jgi:hypothetical protein
MGPGLKLRIPQLKGQHLAFEFLWPIYQSLDGPQPETDALIRIGWGWAF